MILQNQTTEEMKLLFEICYEQKPEKYITRKEIQKIVENKGIISYFDFNLMGDKIKFALRIEKFVGQILSNILMKVDNMDQRASRRKYKFTKSMV